MTFWDIPDIDNAILQSLTPIKILSGILNLSRETINLFYNERQLLWMRRLIHYCHAWCHANHVRLIQNHLQLSCAAALFEVKYLSFYLMYANL